MKKILLNKTQLLDALNTYDTVTEAAKSLNVCLSTFRKNCYENNIPYKKHAYNYTRKGITHVKQFPEIDKNWLITYWVNSDKSLSELSSIYDIPIGLLDSRRSKYKVKKKYKYQVNSDKLFDLQDPNVYYLAGLIATDGYIPKSCEAVEIELTGESEYILLCNIKNYFDITAPIVKYNGYRLRITCKNFKNFLYSNFNINDGAKTFSVGVPETLFNEECAKAFVRGCMDGDGCVGRSGNYLEFLTASEKLVYGIVDIVNKYTDINLIKSKVCINEKMYPIFRATDLKARNFLSWIYSYEGLKLDRKYQNYLSYYKVDDIV